MWPDSVNWKQMTQERFQRRAALHMLRNFEFHTRRGDSLTSWWTSSFSRILVLRGASYRPSRHSFAPQEINVYRVSTQYYTSQNGFKLSAALNGPGISSRGSDPPSTTRRFCSQASYRSISRGRRRRHTRENPVKWIIKMKLRKCLQTKSKRNGVLLME
jgi:hypothetical protein